MKLTVIHADAMIIKDGIARNVSFTIDTNIHAIQWSEDSGTIEYKVGAAEHFTDSSLVDYLASLYEAAIPTEEP